jgi:uncharacterized protein YkwD
MKRALLTLAIALFGLCSAASADVVLLTNGGKVRGKVIKENSREVVVRTAGGTTVVPRDEVAGIEKGATTEELYKKRLAKIDPSSAEARYSLGRWLEGQGARVLARREFKKVIEIEPDHRFAREKLGYIKQDGAWVRAITAKTPKGKAKKRRIRAGISAAVSPKLHEALNALRRGKTAEARKAGLESLLDLEAEKARLVAMIGQPEGKGLRAALAQRDAADLTGEALEAAVGAYVKEVVEPAVNGAVQSYGRRIRQVHERSVRKALGLFRDYRPGSKVDDKRSEALARWNKYRAAALTVIFDKSIYPDENHGKPGQKTVDEHVERVRAVWPAFDQAVGRDLMKISRISPAEAQTLLDRISEPEQRLGEIRPTLGARSLEVEQLVTVPAGLRALLAYQAGQFSQARALQDALNPWEQELMRRMSDERVRAYNAGILKEKKIAQGVRPTGPEVEQVRITNDYRILMGRPALEIDTRLVMSARGHSADMTRLGFFDHTSRVPGKERPSDRMAKAGYLGGGGENISMGSVTPMATHIAWYNSSGHHRNILGTTYRCMGSGQDAEHWTQNFGMQGTLAR